MRSALRVAHGVQQAVEVGIGGPIGQQLRHRPVVRVLIAGTRRGAAGGGHATAQQEILTLVAAELVGAGSADQHIAAGAAVQLIVAIVAGEQVVAVVAVERIVARAAVEPIVAFPAKQRVVRSSSPAR